ncbi:hypothetical protein HMPREF3182_01207 [Megasphaera hutchinsoni]|uniref:Uncharacterized protein n=1 Tax=Megasphaera hutchinsoni TaxID=1588748 RepID=A0A134CEZ7_9FIRM|nr:hypothetical protein HMPREF3182_01207 [Megasphaera hutchinsoni]
MFLLEHPFFLCAIPMLFYANNINYYFILFYLFFILFSSYSLLILILLLYKRCKKKIP